MKSRIDERFGDIEGMNAVFILVFCTQYALMHAGPRVGHMVLFFKQMHEVVGVKHGIFADFDEPFGPQHHYIGVRLEAHAKVTVKGCNIADRFRVIIIERIGVVAPLGDP
jgi:hypothetical protein